MIDPTSSGLATVGGYRTTRRERGVTPGGIATRRAETAAGAAPKFRRGTNRRHFGTCSLRRGVGWRTAARRRPLVARQAQRGRLQRHDLPSRKLGRLAQAVPARKCASLELRTVARRVANDRSTHDVDQLIDTRTLPCERKPAAHEKDVAIRIGVGAGRATIRDGRSLGERAYLAMIRARPPEDGATAIPQRRRVLRVR